jgi:hypothetical protein
MTESLFILILVIHFLADFGLQTHEQAINKSTSNLWLIRHTYVYSLIWFMTCLTLMPVVAALIFAGITFGAHTATDYITSRIAKGFFDKQDYHNGFVVVGMDQVLHYLQLHYTFKLLE